MRSRQKSLHDVAGGPSKLTDIQWRFYSGNRPGGRGAGAGMLKRREGARGSGGMKSERERWMIIITLILYILRTC